jgi:hypothetical protein
MMIETVGAADVGSLKAAGAVSSGSRASSSSIPGRDWNSCRMRAQVPRQPREARLPRTRCRTYPRRLARHERLPISGLPRVGYKFW